jgi:hypothetical protein
VLLIAKRTVDALTLKLMEKQITYPMRAKAYVIMVINQAEPVCTQMVPLKSASPNRAMVLFERTCKEAKALQLAHVAQGSVA